MKNLGWKTSNIKIINAGWNLQILELSLDICLHKKFMYRIPSKLLLIKFFLFILQEEETIEVKEVSTHIYMYGNLWSL